ncbi:hypothetical protein [Halopiger aswanensis]|uniref:Uncharacterized protein n=1 Tax=Halopiger aswanensis TaxID=148449 RepID=A0A3R7DZA2_9EURY|nr:hypothetical protein [Halopiger aswanensis]RKD95124.1 hypothetical protein ATJ93_1975 [Halopiger aswanensis]
MVAPDDDSVLWPYTSKAPAFEERTLPLNVLIEGHPEETRRQFLEQGQGTWNETTPEQEDLTEGEADERAAQTTAWRSADGSTRYTYVAENGSAGGLWLDEHYQLHDGEYLGSRHHIRAYASPDDGDEWTAIQAHSEHWDWFRLSHTVDSVERSQRYVEREFMSRDTAGVTRVHLGNDHGSDANGWVTTVGFEDGVPVHFAALALVPGAILTRRTSALRPIRDAVSARLARAIALAGSLLGLYLSVRFGAIAAETRTPHLDPRLIAGAFYPLIAIGLPCCTYYLSRSLDRTTAFTATAVGFSLAILLDYTLLGVTRLPLNVFVHRFSTAIALGFVAVGASHTVRIDPEDHDYLRLGVLLWTVTLLVPLLRFL